MITARSQITKKILTYEKETVKNNFKTFYTMSQERNL